MAKNKGTMLKVALVLALGFYLYEVEGRDGGLAKPQAGAHDAVFDVTKFGAKGNGKPVYDPDTGETLNALSFVQAWQKACHSGGASKVVIPKGSFAVAQAIFSGPCESHVTVELQGEIIPDVDPSQFPNHELVVLQNVDGVTFTGPGTIDVHRQFQKTFDPQANIDFFALMPSIKLVNVSKTVVEGISSMNPSAFHVLVANSNKVTISNVKFDASILTPNSDSDGVYVSGSTQVSVINSFIRTADACITVAPGTTDVSITGVTCVNGQGISIGADSYTGDLDVKGVTVKNCTFKGSAFGARLFPRPQAKPSQVSNIIFEDLVMEGVQNPIVITQQFQHIPTEKSVQATIANVQFKNIRGTTTTNNVVSFSCNPLSPCESIQVADINLNVIPNALPGKALGLLANCLNAKVVFAGKHDGLSCGLLH